MGRRPVLGVKIALNQVAFRPREKGPLARGCELPTPLASQEPLYLFSGLFFFFLPSLWEISVVIYIYPSLPLILLLHLLVIHASTWVHVSLATPSGTLWAVVASITLSRGHIHINGVRVLAVGINTEVIASSGVTFLPCSYGWPIGLGIFFRILKGTASGDVTSSSPVILACRGQGRPRQYILAVWIPFIRLRALLSPWHGPWTWNGINQSL